MDIKKKIILLSALSSVFFTACEDKKDDNTNNQLEDTPEYGELPFNTTSITGGFQTLNNEDWNKNTVKKVLNTFTYGIVASEEQILTWSDMQPEDAIKEIMNMSGYNKKLKDSGDGFLPEEESRLEFIMQEMDKRYPGTAFRFESRLSKGELISPLIMDNTNYNPFRLKLGLWEVNYHQVINSMIDALFSFNVYHYFDNIVDKIEDNVNYEKILASSAISSPIMLMYGQTSNKYINNEFNVNDDFARELHQLFFGILGDGYKEYYESVTIENTAKILTGMQKQNEVYTSINGEKTAGAPSYNIQEVPEEHFVGNVNILGESINQASIRGAIEKIAEVAIRKNESMTNLPLMIINGLADSNIEKNIEIRQRAMNEWEQNIENADILKFLQSYAISYEFHNEERFRTLSSLDRLAKTYNLLNFEGKKPYRYYKLTAELKKENYQLFYPAKGVFGNLTGEDIKTNSTVFTAFYNRAANNGYTNLYKNTDFSKMIDKDIDNNIKDISEFIWNRFIGDNLKHFGLMERLHIYSLLLYGKDYNEYTMSDIDYTEEYIQEHLEVQDKIKLMSEEYIILNNIAIQSNLKHVTNFVLGLPFMWFEEGK
jgi:hypothetical protein